MDFPKRLGLELQINLAVVEITLFVYSIKPVLSTYIFEWTASLKFALFGFRNIAIQNPPTPPLYQKKAVLFKKNEMLFRLYKNS